MGSGDDFDAPVAVKLLYIKLLFLTDMSKYEKNPVFTRQVRRSGEEFPIYDASIFYQFTHFGENKPRDHEWEFTSSRGQVDALQVLPFDPTISDPDPAKRTIHQSAKGYLRPTPDTLLVVCHNYNGFQKGDGEWAGVRAANDTKVLRLVVDFSSVMTGEDKKLFVEPPRAYWTHELQKDPNDPERNLETPVDFEYCHGGVFSVSQRDVLKKDTLTIRYRMAWDNLVYWQAYHNQREWIPNSII